MPLHCYPRPVRSEPRRFKIADAARICCNVLFYGATWSEIEEAVDLECGIKEDSKIKQTECQQELEIAKAKVRQLEAEVIGLQGANQQLVDAIGTAEAQINLQNTRIEGLATALGAFIALVGLAKLGQLAFRLAKLKAITQAEKVALETVAKNEKLAADLAKDTIDAARKSSQAVAKLKQVADRQPVTIEIIGGR